MNNEKEKTQTVQNAEHFLALARRGLSPAASSGEVQAAKLAKWLKKNMYQQIAGLDSEAVEGFITLIRAANACHWDALATLLRNFGKTDGLD